MSGEIGVEKEGAKLKRLSLQAEFKAESSASKHLKHLGRLKLLRTAQTSLGQSHRDSCLTIQRGGVGIGPEEVSMTKT